MTSRSHVAPLSLLTVALLACSVRDASSVQAVQQGSRTDMKTTLHHNPSSEGSDATQATRPPIDVEAASRRFQTATFALG